MAYLPYDQTQEEQDKDQGAAKEGGASPVLGAPNATPIQGSGGGQAAGTTQGANKPSRSGSFTNLMSYVNANKGNDAHMAGAIKNNVQTHATKADTAGSQFLDTAKTEIGKGTVQQDKEVQQQVTNLAAPVSPTKPAAGAPPSAPQPAPQINQERFSGQYNAEYTGPDSAVEVEGFGDTQAVHNKVANYGLQAGGDMSDRGVLLSDVFGKDGKQYTGGERKLDSFILGAGEAGQAAMKDIADTYSGYGEKFRGIMDTIGYRHGADGKGVATGLVGEGVTTSDATRAAMRGIVDDTQTGFSGYFDPLAAEADARTRADKAEYDAITSGDTGALSRLGLSSAEIAKVKDNPSLLLQLAKAGSGWSLGDVAADDMEGNYGQLMSLLTGAGADGNPKYDFGTRGGEGLEANAGTISGVRDLVGMDSKFAQKVVDANRERDAEQARIRNVLKALGTKGTVADLGQFGMTQQMLDFARTYGVDLSQFVRDGRDLAAGDVLSDKDVSAYTGIMQMLGLGNSGPAGYSKGDGGGGAWSYDTAALQAAIDAAIAANPVSGPAWAEGTILGSGIQPTQPTAAIPVSNTDQEYMDLMYGSPLG